MLRSGVEATEAKKSEDGPCLGPARGVSFHAMMIARRAQWDQGFRCRCRFDRTGQAGAMPLDTAGNHRARLIGQVVR